MKKQIFLYLTAGALAWMSPGLVAQTTNSQPASAQHRQDRQELLRIVGLNRADLKGLSAEDRKAKVKEAVEAKLTELNGKKAAGTITPAEESDLAFLQNHTGHHPKPGSTGSQ